MSQKPFPAKYFIETNNIFAIRRKKPFLFHCVREKKKPNSCQINYTQQNKFRIKPFSEESFP